MKESWTTVHWWLTPLIFLGGGIIIGWIFEHIILRKLTKMTKFTSWQGDDVVISALHRIVMIWFTLAGAYLALYNLGLKPQWEKVSEQVLLTIFIFSVTVAAGRIAVGMVNLYTNKYEGILPSTSIFKNLTYIIIYVLGVLIILHSLGISVTPILTALGVGGLAVALALQDTLSNLFSGLQILVSKQIRQGDYVRLDIGQDGYVEDVTWRNTTIRTLAHNLIIVPNSKLAGAIITNFHKPLKDIRIKVNVGVGYGSDLNRVEAVVMEVAYAVMKEVHGGTPDFVPEVRFYSFGDSSINFNVSLCGQEFADQFMIQHEFIKRLTSRFREENIEIPYPIRTVYLHRSE